MAYILGYGLTACIILFLLRKETRLERESLSIAVQKEMVAYSLPFAPNNVAWWGVSSANKFVIQKFLDSTVLGMYSAALKVPSIINVFQGIVSDGIVLSVLDQYQVEDPDTEYYSMLYRVYSSISIMIVALIIMFAKVISIVLFSKEFQTAFMYVPLLCISPIWGALSGFLGTFYSAAKKTKGMFLSTVFGAVFSILVALLGVRLMGAYAVIVGNIVAYFLIWLYRWVDVKKIVKLDVNLCSDIVSWGLLLLLACCVTYVHNLYVLIIIDMVIGGALLVLNRELLHLMSKALFLIKNK